MATDSLEANLVQQIPVPKGEGDINSSAIETLNLKINKPKKIVLDRVGGASKKVHQFYFVKFWPYKDPDEASKISETEKLIEKLDQDRIRIRKEQKILRLKRIDIRSQIEQLSYHQWDITYGLEYGQKNMLDYLEVVLDKLNFDKKITHKGRANKSYSTGRHTQDFQSWMSHGSSNLATEKQLLRDIASSQQSLSDLEPRSLLQEYIRWYSDGSNIDKTRYTQMIDKMKQIEERKEKALADFANKGKIWNPLSVRRAIQEQIKLVNKISVELRREQCEVMTEIARLEKELEVINEQAFAYRRQQWGIWKQKNEAQKRILKVRQQFDEMNGRHHEYLSLLSNARELAEKKDVQALTKVSHRQVNGFMFEWNYTYDKTFRVSYEVSILPSLHSRQLGRDGRIRNCDQETLAHIEGLNL